MVHPNVHMIMFLRLTGPFPNIMRPHGGNWETGNYDGPWWLVLMRRTMMSGLDIPRGVLVIGQP